MKIALELCYDGTSFFGWQIQNGQISVQQIIQEKIQQLCGRAIDIIGCGRTDTGVHATQYFAHLEVEENDLNHLSIYKINAVLPFEIALINIYHTTSNFHARYDAFHRKYIYKIHSKKNPFTRVYSFYYNNIQESSLNKLNEVANIILQTKDFRSFAKSNSGLENFECTIFESRWVMISEHQFEYHITANRFVRGMVRLCVGACLSYASNKISLDEINESISSGNQINKSWSVPAHGLSLTEVKYPESIQFIEL